MVSPVIPSRTLRSGCTGRARIISRSKSCMPVGTWPEGSPCTYTGNPCRSSRMPPTATRRSSPAQQVVFVCYLYITPCAYAQKQKKQKNLQPLCVCMCVCAFYQCRAGYTIINIVYFVMAVKFACFLISDNLKLLNLMDYIRPSHQHKSSNKEID